MTPFGSIAIIGSKLLYLSLLPIFRFLRLIIYVDSLWVIQYPSSVNMLMETGLLFRSSTCRAWCSVIMLPLGNRMGTNLIPMILHYYPLPSVSVSLASAELVENHSMLGDTWNVEKQKSQNIDDLGSSSPHFHKIIAQCSLNNFMYVHLLSILHHTYSHFPSLHIKPLNFVAFMFPFHYHSPTPMPNSENTYKYK